MSWRHDWQRARAIAWKDLTTERRSKAGFNAVVALAVTILVMLGLALGPDAQALRDARQIVLDAAFRDCPKRFKGRRPQPHALPTGAWINPPPSEKSPPESTTTCPVNS